MLMNLKTSLLRPFSITIYLLSSLFLLGCRDSGTGNQGRTKSLPPVGAGGETTLGEIGQSAPEREWAEIDNPASDGWESEVRAEEASRQLKRLTTLLLNGTPATKENLSDILAPGFKGSLLRPRNPVVVFEDSRVRVERAKQNLEKTGDFAGAVTAVAEEFRGTVDSHSKIKVLQVGMGTGEAEDPPVFTTTQLVSLTGRTPAGVVEHHARWIANWIPQANGPPKLSHLEVRDFERSIARQSWFADCSEAALGGNPDYGTQILRGMNHWLERIPFRAALNRMGTPGLALGDVNGDGLEDLYLCQEPGLPNLLFLQRNDGTVEEVSADWGVDWLQDSRSALLVDLDNDGRQDLAVAIFGALVLARNEGDRFLVQAVLPTSESTTSLTAADYDRDGKLDLYLCAYSPDRSLDADPQALGPLGTRFVFHDAENGSPNSLFRNEIAPRESWRFTNVTTATGLDAHNTRWTFAASWEDFDNDGDPDLYLANDYGRNCLFVNEAGPDGTVHFRNIAPSAGAEDSASGMSATWGDYDRDGHMDLYISNMFSAAGSRVTARSQFKPSLSPDLRRKFQHFARGNTLLRNLGNSGNPTFLDTSVAAGVTIGRWAWSSLFADLNNDGWEDLVVANGYLTGTSGGDL